MKEKINSVLFSLSHLVHRTNGYFRNDSIFLLLFCIWNCIPLRNVKTIRTMSYGVNCHFERGRSIAICLSHSVVISTLITDMNSLDPYVRVSCWINDSGDAIIKAKPDMLNQISLSNESGWFVHMFILWQKRDHGSCFSWMQKCY